jgi:hypothetical protein
MQADFLDSHSNCSICFHNAEMIYEDSICESKNYNPPNQKKISTIKDLWRDNFISTCSVVFRSDLVATIPEWYYYAQFGDWELHIINALHGKIGYINKVMGTYRIHNKGLWSSLDNSKKIKLCLHFYETMNINFNYKYNKEIRLGLSVQYYLLAKHYERIGNINNAREYIIKYFRERPIYRWFGRIKPFIVFLKIYTPLKLNI